MAGVAF